MSYSKRPEVNKNDLLKQYIQEGGLVDDFNQNHQPQRQDLGTWTDGLGNVYEVGLKPEHDEYKIELNEFLKSFYKTVPSYRSRGPLDSPNFINIHSREILLLQHFLNILKEQDGPERLKMEVEKVIGACNQNCACSTERKKLQKLQNELTGFLLSSDYPTKLKTFLEDKKTQARQNRAGSTATQIAQQEDSGKLLEFLKTLVEILELENLLENKGNQPRQRAQTL